MSKSKKENLVYYTAIQPTTSINGTTNDVTYEADVRKSIPNEIQ